MGMAASQISFLRMTARKADIERQEQSLSLQKMALTRDMTRITREYQNSLSTKTLKWSNNAGVSYSDLSYNTLMRPGAANKNKPYLITNTNDQVVLDSKYEKYAKMISPNGASGGDWESNRTKILAELTGISEEKIANSVATSAAVEAAAAKVNDLQEKTDIALDKCSIKTKNTDFMKLVGDIPASYNWYNDWTTTVNLGDCYVEGAKKSDVGSYHIKLDTTDPSQAKKLIKELFETIKKNSKDSLTDEDYKAFSEACDKTAEEYENFIDAFEAGYAACGSDKSSMLDQYNVEVSKRTKGECADGKFFVRISNLMDNLMRNYNSAGATTTYNSVNPNTVYYTTVDRNSLAYAQYEELKVELEAAKEEYKAAVNNDNMALDSEEESNIKFYDQLFSAIAQKGWVANSQIEDNDYLNNMFQNNQYFITTMDEQVDDKGKKYFEYSTDLASNMNNVFAVNATDLQNEALTKYEHEKAIINEKETRIDTRMTNLETELSAINNMMKGAETVRNDNVERTFGIFA